MHHKEEDRIKFLEIHKSKRDRAHNRRLKRNKMGDTIF